ncbi:MAG: DUF3299 domain-containing protein [Planctomycetota bacterium]|nr:MAG: DUF3299 domain-containing protein [Planctomycetota bacterium]
MFGFLVLLALTLTLGSVPGCQDGSSLSGLGTSEMASNAPGQGVVGADGRLHAGTATDPVPIDIDFLGSWTFERKENPFPPQVVALQDKVVRIRGFMLPDLGFEKIRTFHLVRSLWGCCFGAAPRINEILRIELPPALAMDYSYTTLEITGPLLVQYQEEDGLIDDLYILNALEVKELAYDDPEAPEDFDPSQVDWRNLEAGQRPPLMPKRIPNLEEDGQETSSKNRGGP